MNTTNFKVAEIQMTYKNPANILDRPKIMHSLDTAQLMREVEEMQVNIDYKELFYAIYLNQSNRILSVAKVSEGTLTYCLVNIRQIIQGALLQNATAIILCHNHPSGEIKASNADIQVTEKIQQAAAFFDIIVLDHIILSSFNYSSFADEGLL